MNEILDYSIESYELSKHGKQIEKYLFKNEEDAIYTSMTSFVEKKDASYYNPRFVVMNGEDVIGFIFGTFNYSNSAINHLCIFKEYRYQGLGKKLLDRFIEYIKFNNQKCVTLICLDINTNAKLFYKKYGFIEDGYNNHSSLMNGKWHKGILFYKEF